MKKIKQSLLGVLGTLPLETAHAHCDVPCGIYDPHGAQIGALTVIRMIDIMVDTSKHIEETSGQQEQLIHQNNFHRAIAVKEQHAELVKHEIRVIWGDFFKPENKAQHPNLDSLVAEIMSLASKAKQSVDRQAALELLSKINSFAEIFWEIKGKPTKKVKAPYKPEEEIVVPILD